MPKKQSSRMPLESRLEYDKRVDKERRISIVKFITAFSKQKGYAPSIRDIMPVIGVTSSATTHKILTRMEEDALIQVTQGVARSMRVLSKGKNLLS